MKNEIFIIALLFLVNVQCLHFYLTEGKEKCLQDDIPGNTHIQGYWHVYDQLPGVAETSQTDGVQLKIIGPGGQVISQKLTQFHVNEGKGKFSLATSVGGNYKFCMKTTTSHWVKENQKIRYGLRLVVGEQETDVADAAKEQHVSSLHEKIHNVLNKAKEFSKYQEMVRLEEDKLSEENLKINERVVLATIIQTVVILCSGVFQILSLRKFFISKRLY